MVNHRVPSVFSKTYVTPRRPYEKPRLDAELKVIGQFGLRNKREVWRVKYTLAKIRKAARELLTLEEKDEKRLFQGEINWRFPGDSSLILRLLPPQVMPCSVVSSALASWTNRAWSSITFWVLRWKISWNVVSKLKSSSSDWPSPTIMLASSSVNATSGEFFSRDMGVGGVEKKIGDMVKFLVECFLYVLQWWHEQS